MHTLKAALLAGSTLIWPVASHAQNAGSSTPTNQGAAGQDAQVDATDAADADQGEIIVLGSGESRQVQRLDQEDFAILPPGTSPYKAIQKLPGVKFASADAFGAYEWSESVAIRGFNQSQIGFTLDGIPLGDGSYGNTNGLHISRAIISENIGRVQVSQGSGSIGTQATNNLGGTIETFSSDPAERFGLRLNGTYGDENTVRAFGRLDTGVLGQDGPSAYVSYSLLDTDKWKGFGSQRQHQVGAKAIYPAGPVRGVATFNFSDRRENDYQDMSLDMIRRLGYRWDNISNDFPLAVQVGDVGANTGYTGAPKLNPAAGTTYPAPFANADDAYYDAAGLRQDYLSSIGVETAEGQAVHAQLKAYYHANDGQGIWYTPYVASPSGVPISVRTTEYRIRRKGVFGSVGAKPFGVGDLTVGGWYERNDFRQARRFYGLDSRTAPTRQSLEFQRLPFATQWDLDYQTDTFQYYVQSRLPVGPLTVNLGWKGFSVVNRAEPNVAGGFASGRFETKDWFQPHAGATLTLTDSAELFGGFTQVTRGFTSAATSGPFATTQAGFDALDIKPEQSDTYELGARFRQGIFRASLAGFYIDFRDRLIGFQNGAGIIGNPSILQNVGSVRSYGVEATGEVRLPGGFGAFASYAHNSSTYRDDVVNAAGTLVAATAGKTTVDSPRHIASGELTYNSERFFGRVGGDYLSRRYFTYTNDQSVPGRVLFDATAGVRFTVADDRKVEFQVNATNLFDKRYIAVVGTNGFPNSGDSQTLLIGAPRQVFATVKTQF